MNLIYNWILLLFILIVGAGLYLYNGMYNFAATSPHNNLTSLVIHESVEISVKKHAKNVPMSHLGENASIEEGSEEYDEMCAMCHGGPGLPESVLYKGLYPSPPKLYKDHDDWTDEELFWIIKNGIKMTGMPAYGPTHSDEEIWTIVAFVKKLPELSEYEYKTLTQKNSDHHSQHDEHSGSAETENDNVHLHDDGSEHIHQD